MIFCQNNKWETINSLKKIKIKIKPFSTISKADKISF